MVSVLLSREFGGLDEFTIVDQLYGLRKDIAVGAIPLLHYLKQPKFPFREIAPHELRKMKGAVAFRAFRNRLQFH